jgi:acetolactate synthase-1/2/3 large subunit
MSETTSSGAAPGSSGPGGARKSTGGDALVQVLRENGCEVAFGIVSVHNLPLVEAVDRDLRWVTVRHEAAAVNAADAYSRATGKLGCAITSTGTGAGNAAGSLVEALTAGSRVLHVTGNIDTTYLGQARGVIHETKDQLGMLQSVSKRAYQVPSSGAALEILRTAAGQARALPAGPVSVEWPIDLQYAEQPGLSGSTGLARTGLTDGGVPAPEPPVPGDDEIRQAAALLAGAARPAVWIGGGGRDARPEILALAERLNAAVFTSNAGRGTISEDHHLVIGNFAASPDGQALLAEADVLLSIGTHFRSNETRTYKLVLPSVHVQIDVDKAALGRAYPVTLGLHGEATASVAALTAALPEKLPAEAGWRQRVGQTRRGVREKLAENIGPYAAICAAMRDHLAPQSPIARDVTIPSSQWGNRLLPVLDPRTNIFAVGGGIGQGLAMGIGAALARPDVPTLVIAGDGGLSVHLGELVTLGQERPWLVLVVFNDGGYGVLRNMQDAHMERRSGVDLFTPDFGQLAASCGLAYARVTSAGDFGSAFADAIAGHGPAVVEIDVTAVGPTPVPFTPPVAIPGH